MTTIAISGASGFVGGHLRSWLVEGGHHARVLTRPMLAGDELVECLTGVDAVIHLAARAHVLRDRSVDPQTEFNLSNVTLTQRLAAACAAARVRRMVFVSSAGVLGNASPEGGFGDSSQAAPHDHYSRSKLAAEDVLFSGFSSELELVVLRPPLVYGPGAPGNFARIFWAVRGGWPMPFAGFDAPRSMISVRNLCDVLVLAATSDRGAGQRILVADAEVITVAELVREIAAADGRKASLFRVPRPVLWAGAKLLGRETELDRLTRPFVLHGTLAAELLQWVPRFRMADEIRWTVQSTVPGRS